MAHNGELISDRNTGPTSAHVTDRACRIALFIYLYRPDPHGTHSWHSLVVTVNSGNLDIPNELQCQKDKLRSAEVPKPKCQGLLFSIAMHSPVVQDVIRISDRWPLTRLPVRRLMDRTAENQRALDELFRHLMRFHTSAICTQQEVGLVRDIFGGVQLFHQKTLLRGRGGEYSGITCPLPNHWVLNSAHSDAVVLCSS